MFNEVQWEEVPEVADYMATLCREPARDVKRASANVYTIGHVGYHYCPYVGLAALHAGPDCTPADLACCKLALDAAVGHDNVRDPIDDVEAASGLWVKVAYSPIVRRIGEALNFFPGHYPGGIPNHASPLAAILTTALVGGGAGYLGGKLLKKIAPGRWGDKLPTTGLALGAGAGSLLASPYAIVNATQGNSVTDGSLLAGSPDDAPVEDPETPTGDEPTAVDVNKWLKKHDPLRYKDIGMPAFKRGCDLLAMIPLGSMYKNACEAYLEKRAYGTLGGPALAGLGPTPLDVNVNSLGQLLWESGAGPQLTATTMGAVHAASRMNDANARPGWVTGHQLGQLAANAAGDYLTGLAVGGVLNATVGTPWRAPAFGAGTAALGFVGSVVPKLFGG